MDQPAQRPLIACTHSHIVFVDDDGVTFAAALVIRGLTELPAHTRVIVLSGYGASITVAAMHLCVSKHIEVLITSPRYGIMAMFVPSPIINASRAALKVRWKQFKMVCDPVKTVAVARAIISEKIKAEGHTKAAEGALLAGVHKGHAEAKAAQIWYDVSRTQSEPHT